MGILEISAVVHDGIVVVPATLEGHRIHLTIIDQGPGDVPARDRGNRFGGAAISGVSFTPLTRDEANQRD